MSNHKSAVATDASVRQEKGRGVGGKGLGRQVKRGKQTLCGSEFRLLATMAGRTCACHFTFKTFAFCCRLLLLLLLSFHAVVVLAAFQFYCGKTRTETVKGVGVLRDLHLGGSVHLCIILRV